MTSSGATFHLTLISPAGRIFNEAVEEVIAPGEEGCFGVLAGHAPLVASLKRGIFKMKHHGADQSWNVDAGVLEVNGQHDVLVLVDEAVATN